MSWGQTIAHQVVGRKFIELPVSWRRRLLSVAIQLVWLTAYIGSKHIQAPKLGPLDRLDVLLTWRERRLRQGVPHSLPSAIEAVIQVSELV